MLSLLFRSSLSMHQFGPCLESNKRCMHVFRPVINGLVCVGPNSHGAQTCAVTSDRAKGTRTMLNISQGCTEAEPTSAYATPTDISKQLIEPTAPSRHLHGFQSRCRTTPIVRIPLSVRDLDHLQMMFRLFYPRRGSMVACTTSNIARLGRNRRGEPPGVCLRSFAVQLPVPLNWVI